jgi:hypothetical protein
LATFVALVLTLFLNAGCGGGGSDRLHGTWLYASAESEGKSTSVSGTLTFAAGGKFEDTRYIGGIGGFRKGSYSVSGDKLTLTFDDGKGTQSFNFSFGTTNDSTGKQIDTLLLRGSGLSYLLGRKEP